MCKSESNDKRIALLSVWAAIILFHGSQSEIVAPVGVKD